MINTHAIQHTFTRLFEFSPGDSRPAGRRTATPDQLDDRRMAPISLRQVSTPTEATVMTVHGKVDSRCYQWLLAKCEELRRSGTDRLVVNLTEMPDIGLSCLYTLHCLAKIFRDEAYAAPEQGQRGLRRIAEENMEAGLHPRVKLLAANEEAMAMLERAGMTKIFPVHRTEAGALGAF